MASETGRTPTGRLALVTGANRGIGFEIAAGLAAAGADVIVGARSVDDGAKAATQIRDRGVDGELQVEELDVGDPDSVDALLHRVAHVDVLVNNAGVYPTAGILDVDEAAMVQAMQVNVIGPWRLARGLMPAMNEQGWGRVVNVSSSGGQFCDTTPGPGAYGISKTAVNALTKQLADAAAPGVLVNAICPGWVATDMGGGGAPKTPAEGADTAIWLATSGDDGPHGGFFQDRQPIAW